MDSNEFDTVIMSYASGTPRRAILGLLAGSTLGLVGIVESKAKGKKKTTLCLNGQTLSVKKSKKGAFLKQGATPGACAPSPPPPPPPITCASGQKVCGASCIPSNQCCTSGECAAGKTCQGGACACSPGIVTCGGACCLAPATLPVIAISCNTQGTPTCICSVRGSDVCSPGCPAGVTLDVPCANATVQLIDDLCQERGCD